MLERSGGRSAREDDESLKRESLEPGGRGVVWCGVARAERCAARESTARVLASDRPTLPNSCNRAQFGGLNAHAADGWKERLRKRGFWCCVLCTHVEAQGGAALGMEASIEAWLQGSSATAANVSAPEVEPPQINPEARPSIPISRISDGGGAAHGVHTVVPLQLPGSSDAHEASAARTSPAAPMVCPLCHGVSAEVELASPTCDASPAAADSPSPPAGASPTSAAGVSPRSDVGPGGERVQRRALRKVKRGRSINKVGKWWKMYGYNGPPYCQRCSEVFRDHIIRQISNSANCSRANPCTDCTQVLKHLPQPHEEVWAKMDQTKEARGGARAAKQAKKSAAAVGLVQLSKSYDAAFDGPLRSSAQPPPVAVARHGGVGAEARGGGSGGHRFQSSPGPRGIVLPTLRASSVDGSLPILPTLRASSLDGGSIPRRISTPGD